ncbi:tetratricopeptide repeat protein [Streptomyces chartreusis]
MASLKHLVRETFRITVSEAFVAARRGRRLRLLWRQTLGSLNKILILMGVACVVLVTLAVTGTDHFSAVPPVGWAGAGLAALLAAALACRSRSVRILPFKNLTDAAADPQREAVLASGFAELLDNEIRRIVDLVHQEPFMTPADVLNPAGRRGDMVRRSSARVPFKTGVAATGLLPADIKPTEVGTVALGPLKVQVGTVLAWLERFFGTTLQGSLVEADGMLRVVAAQLGLRGGPTWSAQVQIDGDTRSSDARLARELAHRIEFERPRATESGADVVSFQRLVDGLESHKRFQEEGALQDLDDAEDHFRAALARSPEYAAAYHNLGLVYREQLRVRTDIHLMVSDAVEGGPIRMWQKAVALDPTLGPARAQLARAYIEVADRPGEGRRAELLEQAVQSARCALEQPSGAHPMESALARYWLGCALREQAQEGNRSNTVTEEALQCFCRTEQDLLDERGRRLAIDANTTAVRPLAERIAQVVGQQASCWAQLADGLNGEDRQHCINRAKDRARTAISWAPGIPELHAIRGSILLQYGDSEARHAVMEALQRDPENHHLTSESLGVFAPVTGDMDEDRQLAVDLFVLAAHRHPDDAMAWLLLARLAGNARDARSLAGKALALAPDNREVLHAVDQLPSVGAPDAQRQFSRRWMKAWEDARQAERTGNAPRLREALHSVEILFDVYRRTRRPEAFCVSREIGLLHTSLALLTEPSKDRRAHLGAAVDHLARAVTRTLPSGVEVPPLWYVELADARTALAESRSGKGRDDRAARRGYEEAIRNYSEAINRSPKAVRPRYRTGSKGRERFVELTAEQPDLAPRARATAGRAAVYARQGRVNDAIRDCRDALKLAPLYAYPRFTLADLYRERRAQYDLAQQTLKRLIELLPAGVERDRARLDLARTYRMHAEASPPEDRHRLLILALQGLGKATREASLSAPLEEEMYEEMATVLVLLGRPREAIVALRSISDANEPLHAAQHHERIARLIAEGAQPLEVEQELKAAQEACRNRLKKIRGTDEEQVLSADLVRLTAQLAMFYAEHGIRLKEAHHMARTAGRTTQRVKDPHTLAMYEEARGWVAYREGHVHKAVRLLKSAVEYSAGDAHERIYLALALEARSKSRLWHRERDLDQARDIWQQVLDQCPEGPAAEQARHHLDMLPEH